MPAAANQKTRGPNDQRTGKGDDCYVKALLNVSSARRKGVEWKGEGERSNDQGAGRKKPEAKEAWHSRQSR